MAERRAWGGERVLMFRYCEGYYAQGALDGDEAWAQQHCLELGPAETWYREFFYQEDHYNLVSRNSEIGPCVISIKRMPDHTYEVILRVQKGVETFTLQEKYIKTSPLRRIFGLAPTLKNVVAHVCPDHAKTQFAVVSRSRALEERLKDLECPDVQNGKFRIGLVYSTAEQMHETDMFCNNESSPAYQEFLEFIGTKISLGSWTGYDGGLDLANGTSGSHSVFTKHNGNEIMWHVATLMPFFAGDKQQLERKKFIGNDRVVLIFREEGGEPLSPYVVASKAIYVTAIVSPYTDPSEPGKKLYSFSVAIKNSMPATEPELPDPPVFEKGDEFRDFLLDKLISCYAATNYASELKQLMACKYMHGLNQVTQEFSNKGG